jgi:hypothetical protein
MNARSVMTHMTRSCLAKLFSRCDSRNDKVRLPGHAARRVPAEPFDEPLRSIARHRCQRAGKHRGRAGQRSGLPGAVGQDSQPVSRQRIQNGTRARRSEESGDLRGRGPPNGGRRGKLFNARRPNGGECAEPFGEPPRRGRAHARDTETNEESYQTNPPGRVDDRRKTGRRNGAESFEFAQIGIGEHKEIRHRAHKTSADQGFNGGRAKTGDVERVTRGEMPDGARRGRAIVVGRRTVPSTRPSTSGITSPARTILTVSPMRRSFRSSSRQLCSVASDRDAANLHGTHDCDRRQHPGTPYLYLDASSFVVSTPGWNL